MVLSANKKFEKGVTKATMDLNERKRKILQAVIDEYIGTAEPVGSRAISKKENLGLSSATIRNEMADLEELGYLIQPHTSAGRVPSDEGYRFYVNSLMQKYQLGIEAVCELQNALETKVSQLEKIIRRAGSLTSELTNYATFVTTPKQESVIRKIDLVPVGAGRVMLIIVTHKVNNMAINENIDDEDCLRIAQILNERLKGMNADDITYSDISALQEQIESETQLSPKAMVNILNFMYEAITSMDTTEIFVDNAKSILNYPEYRDFEKAGQMIGLLEDKESLKKLATASDENGVSAKIGKENELEILNDCSLVTVNYSIGDKAVGKLGVIGPKRMDYAKVFASLDLISAEIDKILRHYISGE